MTYAGFPSSTLWFLSELSAHNSKAWFEQHREAYESSWREPAEAFVSAVGPSLHDMRAGIVADPRVNGSIFRINRDVRFSRDKTPYRDHLDMWFWEGERSTAVSSLFFRLTPTEVLVGAGNHGFTPQQRDCYRAAVVATPGESLLEIRDNLADGLDGETMKRTPKTAVPVGEDISQLLRHSALFTTHTRPSGPWIEEPGIVNWAVEVWKRQLPLHEWLIDHVGSGSS